MKNLKGAFGSILSILKATVFMLALAVALFGGSLVTQDVPDRTLKVDQVTENQPEVGCVILDTRSADQDIHFEMVEAERMHELPISSLTQYLAFECNSGVEQFMPTIPMFFYSEIDPGGNGQQVPIGRQTL